MRPIATDRVAWSVGRSVGLSVCHDRELCKNGTDRDAVWNVDSGGPMNHALDGVQIPTREWSILRAKRGLPRTKIKRLSRSSIGTVWMPIGVFKMGVCTLAPRRHLANMTEPSVCGDDVALCQITLTTCSKFFHSEIPPR